MASTFEVGLDKGKIIGLLQCSAMPSISSWVNKPDTPVSPSIIVGFAFFITSASDGISASIAQSL